MGEYRVAVVGCGGRAPAHIEASNAIEGVRVVACCAPSGRRRDPLAEKYGLKAYDDAAKMIEAEKPDLVHLITWPDTRVEMMSLVDRAGVAMCTVEKPISCAVDDWRALCELERETETKFAISHQCRWHPKYVRCREAVASGAIGEVRFVEMTAGMNISGQGTHILNYGRGFVGNARVVRVFGAASGTDGFSDGHPAPDSTEAYITFENGARGLWVNGPTAPRFGDPEVVWKHVHAGAFGDSGRVDWQEFRGWEIETAAGLESGDFGGMEGHCADNLIGQTGLHRALIDWHEGTGPEPGTSLAESLHEWQVVLALYASALWRRPVDLADFDPPSDLFDQLREALS